MQLSMVSLYNGKNGTLLKNYVYGRLKFHNSIHSMTKEHLFGDELLDRIIANVQEWAETDEQKMPTPLHKFLNTPK